MSWLGAAIAGAQIAGKVMGGSGKAPSGGGGGGGIATEAKVPSASASPVPSADSLATSRTQDRSRFAKVYNGRMPELTTGV